MILDKKQGESRIGSRADSVWQGLASRSASGRSLTATPQAPPELDTEIKDAELIITVFRTAILVVALFVPRFVSGSVSYDMGQVWVAGIVGIYNIAVGLACLYPDRFGLRRPFIVAMDMLLITLWIRNSQRWDLFPLYYIVVVVAAMWYRVPGGLLGAAFCNFFFLLLWGRAAGTIDMEQPMLFSTTLALNVVLLMLVGCLVGYIAEAQERERTRRLEGQLLVANYQREIDVATQLQPLLISTQWAGAPDSRANGEGAAMSGDRTPEGQAHDAGGSLQTNIATRMIDPTLQLGASMRPAREFGGGDYFDLIPLQGGRTALCIADVSGKSVRAQARLPLLKYSLRALAPLYGQPHALVKRLNETLSPDLQAELFIGLCYIVLDPRRGRLTWCNAGHIAPLLISPRPQPDATDTELPAIHALETTGPVLGPFPEIAYAAQSLPWRPSDWLLLFTDGLPDALSYGGSEDGETQVRRIAHGVKDTSWSDPAAVAQRFVDLSTAALEDTDLSHRRVSLLNRQNKASFEGTTGHRDDITVVVAHYQEVLEDRMVADPGSQTKQA